jgi:hypothetical protein
MPTKKTNKGQVIDMDAIMAQNQSSVAVGNMGVNAKGDKIGKDGVVVQTSEDRVRAYYKDNPKSSTAQASLKGKRPTLTPDGQLQDPHMEVKTAKTQKENVRMQDEPSVTDTVQEVLDDAKIAQSLPQEPDEFDVPDGAEPIGYKEVELPNGDIEMVPIYRNEDL